MQRRNAFTLIELLVVIAIIAILAAILFPVFAQAREKARAISCLSNQKQLATGLYMYLQDFDEAYPMGQYQTLNVGTQYSWSDEVYPYVKNGSTYTDPKTGFHADGKGGLFNCPSFPIQNQTFNYGVHYFLCPDGTFSWNGWTQPKTVSMAAVDAPAEKIFAMEKGQAPSPAWSWVAFAHFEWAWTDTALKNGQPDTTVGTHYDVTKYNCDTKDPNDYSWPSCATMPRYRHTETCNVVFADGHAKAMHKGGINWYKNIYIPGMDPVY